MGYGKGEGGVRGRGRDGGFHVFPDYFESVPRPRFLLICCSRTGLLYRTGSDSLHTPTNPPHRTPTPYLSVPLITNPPLPLRGRGTTDPRSPSPLTSSSNSKASSTYSRLSSPRQVGAEHVLINRYPLVSTSVRVHIPTSSWLIALPRHC